MSSLTLDPDAGPDAVIQLMDDHHLVLVADHAGERYQIGEAVRRRLETLPETQVISIDGETAISLPLFCRQLERQILPRRGSSQHGPHGKVWWRDLSMLVRLLRETGAGNKRRYIVWNEADAMLEADAALFSRIVNALLGVAAEHEHVTPDPLILHRVVFIGGARLADYAADDHGQFNRWLEGDAGPDFWEAASVLDAPPVLTYRLEG